jgi:hypothetical protein
MDPAALMIAGAADGLCESFYFRGNSRDGRHAFWLRHNLLRRHGERGVLMETVLVLFERRSGWVLTAHDREDLGPAAFAALVRARNWEALSVNLASGSFFETGRDHLRGRLHTARGRASWDLALTRSDEVLWHFPLPRLYSLPLPPKKLLMRDCRLQFSGRLSVGEVVIEGDFVGSNGHHWGSGYAHEYAYGGCNLFREDSTACFDGFSARFALAGRISTPRFSMAALRLGGEWHRFNAIGRAYRHRVDALDDYRWKVLLKNDTHRLEVAIDGANPRIEPWVALHCEHADGSRAVVKNTKFASGRLRLYERGARTPLAELHSEDFELETVLPGNVPADRGFVGEP